MQRRKESAQTGRSDSIAAVVRPARTALARPLLGSAGSRLEATAKAAPTRTSRPVALLERGGLGSVTSGAPMSSPSRLRPPI